MFNEARSLQNSFREAFHLAGDKQLAAFVFRRLETNNQKTTDLTKANMQHIQEQSSETINIRPNQIRENFNSSVVCRKVLKIC